MNTKKCTRALYYVHAPQNLRPSINTAEKSHSGSLILN